MPAMGDWGFVGTSHYRSKIGRTERETRVQRNMTPDGGPLGDYLRVLHFDFHFDSYQVTGTGPPNQDN